MNDADIKRLNSIIKEKCDAIMQIPVEKIENELLTRYFGRVFNRQINSLYKGNSSAKVRLEMGNQHLEMTFKNDECIESKRKITLLKKAVYIDNPFIVDKLDGLGTLNAMDELLKTLLLEEKKTSMMDGIIDSVMNRKKLDDIFKTMNTVVNGEILEKDAHEFFIKQEKLEEPISFHGLSTGLKSFVLIKMLLEKGCLRDGDVLILDEPEIHLHPQWQVAYAELIVLLQKQFDLRVVVTTHSPYFLDAINLFSIKYETSDKTNYYLAYNEDNGALIESVTGDINKIYEEMATPIQQLETLRYQLNNQ